jgi:hypothetical protein
MTFDLELFLLLAMAGLPSQKIGDSRLKTRTYTSHIPSPKQQTLYELSVRSLLLRQIRLSAFWNAQIHATSSNTHHL